MRRRFDFRSIRSRIWLSFLGFAVILLVVVWFLQINLVNRSYMDMKIERTEANAHTMLSMLDADQMKEFRKTADDITQDNDVFVVYEKNGQILYPVEPPTSYIHEMQIAKKQLADNLTVGGARYYTTTVRNDADQPRTYVFASLLQHDDNATLYVFSPLYPVKSTIEILQDQLVVVIFIALGLAFLISYYLATRITSPIRHLTRSAGKLAEGDYSARFVPGKGSYSEITNLSRTLNQAAIELGKTQALQEDIMANVSHDLRTPLTMIKSYAEMIRDLSGDNPEKRNEHLQVIIDESDRLGTLVSDMMALSQLQAGTLAMHMDAFDIKEATENILNPYMLLEKDGYSLEFNCSENYRVIGDEERIKQVISNLLTNAIKYCGADKKIIINIRRWGRKVHFEIIDHGVGIKPEELDYIWERYHRSSSNHVRSTGGSGLGLSIVSQILTLHDAKFGAESKVDQGTTFWFELESPGVVPVNIPTMRPTDTLTISQEELQAAMEEQHE